MLTLDSVAILCARLGTQETTETRHQYSDWGSCSVVGLNLFLAAKGVSNAIWTRTGAPKCWQRASAESMGKCKSLQQGNGLFEALAVVAGCQEQDSRGGCARRGDVGALRHRDSTDGTLDSPFRLIER